SPATQLNDSSRSAPDVSNWLASVVQGWRPWNLNVRSRPRTPESARDLMSAAESNVVSDRPVTVCRSGEASSARSQGWLTSGYSPNFSRRARGGEASSGGGGFFRDGAPPPPQAPKPASRA